ncbi:hydrogenase expression/formation protein HypE [Candidatus Sumerlaeota bacterium]|nr:hydrogenase expression/formation protein HypE [Candidatus Sumerlaeota bacterium]
MDHTSKPPEMACPLPISDYPHVLMAHGGGGRLMHQLLSKVFYSAFANPLLDNHHDGAALQIGDGKIAFTTDGYVVQPMFFPGGDLGTLAVYGTVNDLAMCGARPAWLSAGFILEEGLPVETLTRVVESMRQAAQIAKVVIVTGDTKVVERGKCDGVFVTTAGVGVIEHGRTIGPTMIQPGDAVILSGDLGRHGMAIMAQREGLEFDTTIESDCAPLGEPVQALLEAGVDVHCLRDLTRGGLCSALVELSGQAQLGVRIEERKIPVDENVASACELLGLDPLYVANEGRMVAIVAAEHADRAVQTLQRFEVCAGSRIIGEIVKDHQDVILNGVLGVDRVLDMLSGEQLPRIC